MKLDQKILALLQKGDMTARQIQEALPEHNLKSIQVTLAKTSGLYVKRYTEGLKGQHAAVYTLGYGIDAPNPKAPKRDYKFPLQGLTVWQPVRPWVTQ